MPRPSQFSWVFSSWMLPTVSQAPPIYQTWPTMSTQEEHTSTRTHCCSTAWPRRPSHAWRSSSFHGSSVSIRWSSKTSCLSGFNVCRAADDRAGTWIQYAILFIIMYFLQVWSGLRWRRSGVRDRGSIWSSRGTSWTLGCWRSSSPPFAAASLLWDTLT